jgi:hypothetical protein
MFIAEYSLLQDFVVQLDGETLGSARSGVSILVGGVGAPVIAEGRDATHQSGY